MLIPFTFGLHMSNSLEPYIGYSSGASRSTHNRSSTTWAIFAPNGELVTMQRICVDFSTDNITKYSTMVQILSDAI